MKKRKPDMRRYIVSKWAKTKAILPNASLARYIPETRRMDRSNLREMLEQYGMVYVKPDYGTYGIGVMRVEKQTGEDGASYRFQAGTKARSFVSYDAMYEAIRSLTGKRLYLAQKGIQLLKYKNRRFDLRVMVQKNLRNRWETTGVIGRVAAPRKVVTNIHNGGTLKPVETLLRGYVAKNGEREHLGQLRRLGTSVAAQLSDRYPGIKEIGLDVALDGQLKPWILEVNTSPDPWIFRKLKDKRIFQRIRRYSRAYGRMK